MKTHALYLGGGQYLAAFPTIGKPLPRTTVSFGAYQVSADVARDLAEAIPGAQPILVLDPLGWRESVQHQEGDAGTSRGAVA